MPIGKKAVYDSSVNHDATRRLNGFLVESAEIRRIRVGIYHKGLIHQFKANFVLNLGQIFFFFF